MSDSFSLGIDVGGTKILIGLISTKGPPLRQFTELPTHSSDGVRSAQLRLVGAIENLLKKSSVSVSQLCSIGIGAPGPLNLDNRTFDNPYTLPGWEGWSMSQFLFDKYGRPITFENDADMTAYGEYKMRKNSPDPMLILTIGTGIGGSLVTGGEIYRGASREHPEIGLIPTLDSGDDCYSNVVGSLESWASGTSFSRKAKEFGLNDPGELFTSMEKPVVLYKAKIEMAWKRGIQTFLHCYYPQEIVFAGGVTDYHFDFFQKGAIKAIKESRLIDEKKVRVSRAILGKNAGAIGAACYAFDKSV